MKYASQLGIRSVILLGIVFTLGLLFGYISHTNTGFKSYTLLRGEGGGVLPVVRSSQEQREIKMVHLVDSEHSPDTVPRVPSLVAESSGVVYDCVTWVPLYGYDPQEVTKNYREFPDIHGTGEADDHRKKSFVDIYNQQIWGGREVGVKKDNLNYKASGPGSALERSQGVIAILHVMIDRLKTELNKSRIKILDLPCGDLQYMSHFLRTRTDVDYTGADIVPELIAKHKENYKGSKHTHFENIDIVKDKLNDSYDLIICRMMLQHLVHEDVLRALYHFSSSNSSFLAATTFSDNKVNQEVRLGGVRFRHLNLEKSPVSLSPPVCTYAEPIITEHRMAIWKLPLLQRLKNQ